jgi:Uncharacterized conserved protein
MRKLGLSVYPKYDSVEAIIHYLQQAQLCGFSRIFTCLISAHDAQELKKMQVIHRRANEMGFEIFADVNPSVFSQLHLTYHDLSYFKDELYLSGIRLDLGFSGAEEAEMSFNSSGLKVELNISSGTKYIENILSYQPDRDNLVGCHNFYPHRYTGLSRRQFLATSELFKKYDLRTAAMISSANGRFGPWAVIDGGLPTLEAHRGLPITVQARDLWHTGLIDDLIIGNMYASDEELKALGSLNRNLLQLDVVLSEADSDVERKIILEEPHTNRGDVSDYMIRSTMTRVKYGREDFPPHDTRHIIPGDVLIDNNGYTRYKGELQIALKEMENSGNTTIVGRIVPEERYLLDVIRPWDHFLLREAPAQLR